MLAFKAWLIALSLVFIADCDLLDEIHEEVGGDIEEKLEDARAMH